MPERPGESAVTRLARLLRAATREGAPAAAATTVVVDYLDEVAPRLLTGNGMSLVPFLDALRLVPLRGHPWAELVVAHAVHSADPTDPQARRLVAGATAAFRRAANQRGVGYASYLRGNWALAQGELHAAVAHWDRARRSLPEQAVAHGHAFANSSWAAWADGDIRRARVLADQAVASATAANDPRLMGVALAGAAGFAFWAGDLSRVQDAARSAEEVFARVPEADRIELPVALGLAAGVEALRGDAGGADDGFAAALCAADSVGSPWIRAVVLTLRAEFCVGQAPDRSLSDAVAAREVFEAIGEQWWLRTARAAQALAVGAAGSPRGAVELLDQLLGETQHYPLQRAHHELLLGEQLVVAGETARAGVALRAAAHRLEAVGASYWTARALCALAAADPAAASRLRARARQVVAARGAGGCDVASRRLLRGPQRFVVTLLGRPEVEVDGRPCDFATRQARLLVLTLAAAGDTGLASGVVEERLWPQAPRESATRRLKTAVWQARRALGPVAGRLQRTRGRLVLDLDDIECDLLALTARARMLTALARARTEPAEGRTPDEGRTGVGTGGRAAEVLHLVELLGAPVLGGEEDADWVVDLQHEVDALRDRLDAQARGHR